MAEYDDIWYRSSDGLRLYAREYAHPAPRATVLCMHGLTRNSADFADLCTSLHGEYRLLAVDQRGRGRSDYDPNPANYTPIIYVRDMFTLLDQLGLDRVVAIGTSMGGVMSMFMAAMQPLRLQAVVLNDIGPVIDPVGLERIKAYVGLGDPVSSWDEAAAQARSTNGIVFPDWDDHHWLIFAKRLYRENEHGVPVLAYDPAIAQSLRQSGETALPLDLWPAFAALAPIPTLVIRGATSDILAPDCVAEMQRRKPDLATVDVPNRGHAPMLDEPVAIAAIRHLLSGVAAG